MMKRRGWLVVSLVVGSLAAWACAKGGAVDEEDAGVDASIGPDAQGSKDSQPDGINPGDAGCPDATKLCGAFCVNTQSDPQHCGDCTTVCTTADAGNPGDAGVITAVCTAGACGVECDGGLTQCGEQCFDEKN